MKHNIIVICIDSLRADCVGPDKGMGFVQTPNIDRLASESVVFDRCYAEGLPTVQVRRCFFTGRRSYPFTQVVPHEGLAGGPGWHPIAHDQDTLAEMLHDSGYLTGLVADTYHLFKPAMNFTRGFVSWQFVRGQENDTYRSGPLDRIDLAAHVPEGEATPAHHPTVAQYLLNALDRRSEEDWQCAQVFRKASDWLVDNRKAGPFMLWVDSFTPHELWDPPRHYADAYCPPKPGVRDIIYPQAFHAQPKGGRPEIPLTPDETARCKALYLGFVTFVDRWVGHLLQTVDKLGLFENSIIMFITDHGTELMDKSRFGKGGDRLQPFNTRVPWFIRMPDGPRGLRCNAWTQNLDFTPTLLALSGVEARDLDGANVWPIALGDAPPHRDHVTTGWGVHACVRDDHWAVHLQARNPNFAETAVAYDLQADPEETKDVAHEHPDAVRNAVERLGAVTGPLPVQFEHYKQRAQGRSMRTFAVMRP